MERSVVQDLQGIQSWVESQGLAIWVDSRCALCTLLNFDFLVVNLPTATQFDVGKI